MDSDGVLTDTGQLIDIGDTGNGEVEVAPDNKYVYVTNDSGSASGLVVLEIDENNNVTKKGRATGGSMQGCGELIVSKDSKTVLLIGIQGMEVYNVQENGDVIFNGQYFWLPLAQSAAMTPDGKYVVVAYDYRLEQEGLLSTLAVFRMNSDGTVTNLDKDVTLENLPGEMKFYQLPTPSVDIDWQMYK
jgi:DNA-binding beta-propeller fold protein YncE